LNPAQAGARRGAAAARLFFAAWPDQALQQSLHDIGRRCQPPCGGRAVPSARIHLTLAFLGALPRSQIAALTGIADSLPPLEVPLTLDCLGYWRGPQVLWAGASVCPAALTDWVAGLTATLRQGGFRTEARAFVPHVTLLRRARRMPPSTGMAAVVWPVAGFALVESVSTSDGPGYQSLHRWP